MDWPDVGFHRIPSLSLIVCVSINAAPEDYLPINQTLTFDSETVRQTVSVSIVDDAVDENLEDLIALLALEIEADEVQLQPAEATLLIIDDDG